MALEHACFAVALAAGLLLAGTLGLRPAQARWYGLKLGLVVFLVLPLEAMHAWFCHVWIARGLRQTASAPYSKDLRRGLGMAEMVRALEAALLPLALPLLAWLSVRRPF